MKRKIKQSQIFNFIRFASSKQGISKGMKLIITSIGIVAMFLWACANYRVTSQAPASCPVYPGAPSFTIWKDSTNSMYYALDASGNCNQNDTNASAIIQYALNNMANDGYGTVYIRAGTYNITNTISLSTGQNLFGEGMGSTFLETSENITIIQIQGQNQTRQTKVTIRDLYLRGSKDSNKTNQIGIYIDYATDVTIENVYIYRLYNGITSVHSNVVLLKNVFAWESENVGINLVGAAEWDIEQWLFTNVQVGYSKSIGINMHYAMGIRVLSTMLTMNYGAGWYSSHTYQVMINEGDFNNSYMDNIEMRYDQYSIIMNSWIGCANFSGIFLHDNCNFTKIIGNTIAESGNDGIKVVNGSSIVIDGNTIFDNALNGGEFDGIRLEGVSKFILSDTQVQNFNYSNQTWGIRVIDAPSPSYSIIDGVITNGKTGGIYMEEHKDIKVSHSWNGTSYIYSTTIEYVYETRHCRNDQHTINGLNAYKLNTTSSTGMYKSDTKGGYGNLTVYWGIKVWIRASNGTETLISDDTPVAQVSRSTSGAGYQNSTWLCPQKNMTSTDAIVVRFYIKLGSGDWQLSAEFITEQLGASQLGNATWIITYFTQRNYNPSYSILQGTLYWGSNEQWFNKQCYIENFCYLPQIPP
jgi:parallel beta-helix repeat protein